MAVKRKTENALIPRRQLVKVDVAAAALGIAPKTLWGWIGKRSVEVVRLGRCVRIPETEISRLIEAGTTPVKSA